jgi:hypothetical protein
MIKIHLVHSFKNERDEKDDDLLLKIFQELHSIKIKIKTIMATLQQFQAALDRIDAATTDIANDLTLLKEQITNAGLSAEVEAEVIAKLETAATKLEGIGASVENPVPPTP